MIKEIVIPREVIDFFREAFPDFNSMHDFFRLFIFLLIFIFLVVVVRLGLQFIVLWVNKKRIARYIRNSRLIQDITDLDIEDSKKYDLVDLVIQCVTMGEKIDVHTDRKNNSKNVSALVYDICRTLSLDPLESIVYACCAFVYDAGFLDVQSDMFLAEILKANERDILRHHVMSSFFKFDFVPAEYQMVFINSAVYHHENYDGTGYPEGIAGEEIPLVAQIIRVAETYVSLTNARSYHKKRSRQEALAALEKSINCYNSSILKSLEFILQKVQ